ncbi:hypothetical protein ICN48_05675 [Polynucleobacter sp. JS-Safj-400b-B2]|uniref:hypothetical protein n=1 Tax=Polynucleobacter sp. JS-Safj-400b-B2 TaxID=2576921 RepID=UPI001C0D1F0E|nr:hypothetical protein [Polynucleobacter sp. JS-Safj-400b-B2]MBU3625723.1 hypothetical protein [Polynucleobacter sp. JS-Safj-400b-B2]
MTTYNLDTVANALIVDSMKRQNGNGAYRYDRYYNVLAQAGLVVGDVAYFDIDVPEWVRTITSQKRSSTSNADSLVMSSVDPQFNTGVQPLLFSIYANTPGTSNANTNCNVMACKPVGSRVRVALTLAGSVPTSLVLGVSMYDS